jgi:hypothetical protein
MKSMNKKTTTIFIGVLIVLGLVIFLGTRSPKTTTPTGGTVSALGFQSTEGPWIAEVKNLKARLASIGLPALSAEGEALHIHQHIDIVVHGKPVVVPPGIGVSQRERFISPIHTHDTDSIIHIESPVVQVFYPRAIL